MRFVYSLAQIPVIVIFVLFPGTVCWSGQASPQLASADPHRAGEVEDWSSLSLTNSHLHAERPILGEKDDDPQFTRELLQMKWRPGDPIDLYVIKPKGVNKPPVVLYLYGYPSETDRFRDNRYCARITSGGFAAIGFVSALTGQRYQNRPMKQWFVSELQESLGSSVHDVQMVLNYLASRDDLDLSRVGIFGEGSGGTIAILAAAADARIKAIDVLDPWGDWPDWMTGSKLIPEDERPNYEKAEFLKKVAPLDPVLWLPQLHSQHIRIQQLIDDPMTPKAAQERIDSVAPASAQLLRYEGNLQLYAASSGGRLFQWIKNQLRSGKELQPAAASLEKSQSPEKQGLSAHPQ
ncbi:MAG TPA: dienelactone hydrolase family protein [Terriglobales bacterium]|nr:dienelactone hydrolase family protein [Terriglobales bacterium]